MGGQRYSDDFRAGAVLMAEADGWPTNKGAMSRVAARLGVNERTLRRWATGESNPPPDKNVRAKKLDLEKVIRKELASAFEEMGRARQDASYRDLGTVVGILFDKLQLLSGEPTQSVTHIVMDR